MNQIKSIADKVTDQVLSLLGLETDLSFDLGADLCNQITESIYLGARPKQKHLQELKAAGITHVVSCLPEKERPRVKFLGDNFAHLFLAVHDGMREDIAGTFSEFFDFAAAVTRSPKAKMLVHCEVGVSRSATLVIALLMKNEAISFMDAVSRVREKRGQVLPNIGFASQLQQFEHELQPDGFKAAPSSLAIYLHRLCNAPVEIELLQSALERQDYDALAALRMIFGDDIPRVIQGVRS